MFWRWLQQNNIAQERNQLHSKFPYIGQTIIMKVISRIWPFIHIVTITISTITLHCFSSKTLVTFKFMFPFIMCSSLFKIMKGLKLPLERKTICLYKNLPLDLKKMILQFWHTLPNFNRSLGAVWLGKRHKNKKIDISFHTFVHQDWADWCLSCSLCA